MRLLVIILFAACGSRDAETAPTPQPSSSETAGEVAQEAEAPAETPIDPAPAPVIDLQSVPDDGVALRVRATGDDAVELRRNVRIERQSGESWESADAEYKLRVDCQEVSGECVTLAVGAELSAPPLTTSAAQCGGDALAPGTYRFVVESCAPEGARPHEITSVFTLQP
ncbi:MAG: hypothetical protein AB8H86_15685 [Polyangiales bacterium]